MDGSDVGSVLGSSFGGAGFAKFKYIWTSTSKHYSLPEDDTNIFKSSFLNVFGDLESINIEDTQNGEEYWPFSLFPFTSIITQNNCKSS